MTRQVLVGTPVPAVCRRCGAVFDSPLPISPAAFGEFSGNTIQCRCGGTADILDAFTSSSDGIVAEIVSSPGQDTIWDRVTAIQNLRAIANDLNSGKITLADARQAASQISKPAAQALNLADQLSIVNLLVAILSIILAYYAMRGDDADHDELIATLKKQTEISQQISEEQLKEIQLIRKELKDRDTIVETLAEKLSLTKQTKRTTAARKSDPNRHQRRKEKAENRRKRG